MKRLFAILIAVAVAMCSCSKIFDTSVLERNIVELKDRITALEEQCKQMNTNISSLQTIVTALQNNDYVTGVAPITQNGVEIGYTISFSKSGSITIYHGKDGSNGLDGSDGSDGSDGASGSTPVVGVKQDTDGVYYWTLNGEWLLNDKGEKVKAISTDGKDGEDGQDGTNGKDGKDGITPQLKIENGYWYVSYNNGESWESLGKATGDNGQDGANGADGAAGKDGDSFFQSVTQDENNVIFTLADGTVITVPKSSSYLFNKLQSVSYVPKFNDGKATVYYSAASNSQVEMDFEVSPKDAAAEIAAQWETILFLKAVNTQTRAVTYIDMPILGCTADAQHGVITVTASGKNLAENFFSGEQSVSARLGISDGNTNITSEYIELFAAPAVEPFSNEIWYTATEKVTKDNWTVDTFGANITDHTFDTITGKGVITFDGEVTKIGTQAFYECRSLTSVTIPDSVTEIGNVAFISCYSLTSITIPDSVTKIGDEAFYLCTNLTSVTIGNGVTEIGYGAFISCDGLTSVTIPDSVTSIGDKPFEDCKNLAEFKGKFASEDGRCLIIDGVLNSFARAGITTYNIPDSVTKIGTQAFRDCDGLTSITIPDSVTEIESNPFSWCNNLAEFKGKFAADNGRCLIVNGVLKSFAPAGITTYNIPDSVTEIGYYAFDDCDGLTSITIPDSVTKIGGYAFWICSGLTSITIPDSVTEIGWYAFGFCSGLTSVFCERTTPPTANFGGYSSWSAFENNATGRKIYVPTESVDAYKSADGWKEYADAIVADPNIQPNNEIWYASTDGNIVEPCDKTVFGANIISNTYKNGKGIITFDGEVTEIGDWAFSECSSLTSVTIPESVTEIGKYTFRECNNLAEFKGKFAADNGRCLIIDGVLKYFAPAGLTQYTIPDGVTEIGYSAFSSCYGLTSITIPDSVTSIEYAAFDGCDGLTSVFCERTTPPTALIEYGSWDAFENNAADRKIYVPTESVDAYKSADGWSKYANAIEPYDFSAISE